MSLSAARLAGFLTLALISLIASVAAPRSAPTAFELFRIERSTNKNYVRYDARVLPDGSLDAAAPITAYWVMLAENGHREEMTWLERSLAYGFSVTRDGTDSRLSLVAFNRRPVVVHKAGDGWRAEVQIAGRPSILRRIWVQSEGSLFGPRVLWIELHGIDVNSHREIVERIHGG